MSYQTPYGPPQRAPGGPDGGYPYPAPPSPMKKKSRAVGCVTVAAVVAGVIAVLAFVGALAGAGDDDPTTTASETPSVSAEPPAPDEAPAPTAPPSTAAPTTTLPPEPPEVTNARRSAESYLEFSGFSRQGLIDQLSSEYGDQYPVDVATTAVDSMNVDWNAEAVESAESYLDMSGFSHAGLVDQLSSEYGDQYTREQAEHGATVALGG